MLHQTIQNDLKTAMKAGDAFSLGVLRMLSAALQNKGIEKRGKGLAPELTDDEARDILLKEMKKRQDAMGLYAKGGRADLAERERKEAEYIGKYLPARMGRAEAEKIIEGILLKTRCVNFGEAMKAVMTELKGKADAQIISEIIKEKF